MRYERSLCHALRRVVAHVLGNRLTENSTITLSRGARWISLCKRRVIHDQFVTPGAITLSPIEGQSCDQFVTQSYRSEPIGFL